MQPTSQKASLPPNNHVQIIETEASIRCGLTLDHTYELVLELCRIVLQRDHKVLFEWPFKHIRRYGYTNNSFSFEAGSKCETGEGLFIFRSPQSIQLYNRTIENVSKLKQFKNNNSLRHPHMQLPADASHGASSPEIASFPGQGLFRKSCELDVRPPEGANRPNCTLAVPHYVRNNCEYAVVKRSSKRDC